jgi:hypothetical protein
MRGAAAAKPMPLVDLAVNLFRCRFIATISTGQCASTADSDLRCQEKVLLDTCEQLAHGHAQEVCRRHDCGKTISAKKIA